MYYFTCKYKLQPVWPGPFVAHPVLAGVDLCITNHLSQWMVIRQTVWLTDVYSHNSEFLMGQELNILVFEGSQEHHDCRYLLLSFSLTLIYQLYKVEVGVQLGPTVLNSALLGPLHKIVISIFLDSVVQTHTIVCHYCCLFNKVRKHTVSLLVICKQCLWHKIV